MFRYHLPDGRSSKRLWEGWMGPFTILVALLEHCARKISRMEGSGASMIFAAVFTVRWRVLQSATLQFPYQTVMQLVSTLSKVPLQKVVKTGGGRLALFSRRRKCRRCCAFLESHGVGDPDEILCNLHPQEFSAADSLHSRAVDGQWGVVNRVSPEVHHNLVCLLHIEGQVVSTTPFHS